MLLVICQTSKAQEKISISGEWEVVYEEMHRLAQVQLGRETPGRTLQPNGTCQSYRQLAYLNLPYHTMYRTANEILCGLEGVDWVDDGTGAPDQCTAGLFDPVSGVSVTTQAFSGSFVGRSAFDAGGIVRFIGTNFDLTPGDAYLFNMNTGYADRLWLPPHF